MDLLNSFLWQGTITHISVGLLHKNWTDFLHSTSSQRLDSSRPGEQRRPLSPDPPWSAETGVRRLGSALVTISQSEFLKKRTRSIAVTVTVTHCQHHSKGWKLNSSARKHLDTVTVYPRHYFKTSLFPPLSITREWIECCFSGSQSQPPASPAPVAGPEEEEASQRGGDLYHSARTRGHHL